MNGWFQPFVFANYYQLQATDLSDLDKAKLESCIEQIKNTLGPLTISKNELANIVISNSYDVEKATNTILDMKNVQTERKEKGEDCYNIF